MWFKKNNRIDISEIEVKLDVSNTDVKKIIALLDLKRYDLKLLKHISPLITTNSHDIINNFYKAISQDNSLVGIVEKYGSVDNLKSTLRQHILQMFSGTLDDEYIKKRETVADIHVNIGLVSSDYIVSFSSILKDVIKLINDNIKNDEDKLATSQALIKLISLEKYMVLERFDSVVESQRQAAQKSKDNLSAVIIDSTTNLASVSEESTASYQQIMAQVHNILEFSLKAQQLASQMEDKANEGKLSIQRQSSSMHHIIDDVEAIKKDMSDMMKMNRQIEEVVYNINRVASQINLIALNSSIESARLGEQGKGFAVISQEIRKLSVDVNDSIKIANSLLSNMHNETEKMHHNISSISSSVEGGKINLLNTEDRFAEIMTYTHDNNTQVYLIKNEINDLENVMTELNEALVSVATSAETLSDISSNLLQ